MPEQSHRSPRRRAIALLFAAGLLPWMAWSILTGMIEQAQSARWPAVPGTVVESAAEFRFKDIFFKSRLRLRYLYRVGDQEFAGTRWDASGMGFAFKPGSAPNIAAAHPVGSAITVRHDPGNAARSVLRAGAGFWDYSVPSVVLAVIVWAEMRAIRVCVRWLRREGGRAET